MVLANAKLPLLLFLLVLAMIYWLTTWRLGWIDRTFNEVAASAYFFAAGWLIRSSVWHRGETSPHPVGDDSA